MMAWRFKIDRKRLDEAPEKERALFLMLGHFANQQAILAKWVNWVGPVEGKSEFEHKGRVAQSMMVLTLLAAKLNEGWELLQKQYFGSGVSKEYDEKLDNDAKESLSQLKRYFSGANAVRVCRNEYAFHYDADALNARYSTLPAEEDTDFYIAEFPGCSLFHVAEMAAGHALLEGLGNGDRQVGMQVLMEETLMVSMWFQTITAAVAMIFLDRIGMPDFEASELNDLPAFEAITVPFLTEVPAA